VVFENIPLLRRTPVLLLLMLGRCSYRTESINQKKGITYELRRPAKSSRHQIARKYPQILPDSKIWKIDEHRRVNTLPHRISLRPLFVNDLISMRGQGCAHTVLAMIPQHFFWIVKATTFNEKLNFLEENRCSPIDPRLLCVWFQPPATFVVIIFNISPFEIF